MNSVKDQLVKEVRKNCQSQVNFNDGGRLSVSVTDYYWLDFNVYIRLKEWVNEIGSNGSLASSLV